MRLNANTSRMDCQRAETPSERVQKIKLREQGVTATTHDRADYP